MLCQILTDGSSHSQTRVGVDVDLADSTLSGLAELLLGDTNCIGQLTTILVDGVNLFLRNRRRTMKHDGESGQLLLNLCQHVECEWRRNEPASLRVACALLGLELVGTVRSTDRDGQRVAACTGSEVDYFLRLCIMAYL